MHIALKLARAEEWRILMWNVCLKFAYYKYIFQSLHNFCGVLVVRDFMNFEVVIAYFFLLSISFSL